MSQSFTHVLAVGIAAMLVSACSNNDVLRKADDLIANGRVEDALVQMETTLKSDPRNVLVRSRLFRERDVYVNQLLIQADGARAGGDIAMAVSQNDVSSGVTVTGIPSKPPVSHLAGTILNLALIVSNPVCLSILT